MARNRQDLVRALSAVTSELLKEKGYICFVDVLMKLDYLSQSDYEHWRFQRVSPLERVLRVNLSRINFIMKTVRRNSLNGHLKPSITVYKSWGKSKKTLLQFSKSGDPRIETAYATHFVKPKCGFRAHFGDSCKRNIMCSACPPRRGGQALVVSGC